MKSGVTSNIKGNYYIRIRPTGWFVWYQYYNLGKRYQEKLDAKAFGNLGFKPTMSVDEVKSHCKLLNKERSLLKEKMRIAAKRVTSLTTLNETLFPQDRINIFQELLTEENFGSEQHLKKVNSHFVFIQKMCNELRLQPIEYKDNSKKIYKYFIKQKISPNYAARLISLLNRWGKFVAKTNGVFYDDVQVPRGLELSAIADAQQTKSGVNTELGVRTESLPLETEKLLSAKNNLNPEQYNWLLISVWFGLRPEEIDSLKNSKNYRIEFNIKTQISILHVYQSKLRSISANKRWKKIPVIFKEQQECIAIIKTQSFKRPLHKIVRKYVGMGITLYGGRKAFVDLMLSKQQTLENISMWLGHKDISTTWKHYKDKYETTYTATNDTITKIK